MVGVGEQRERDSVLVGEPGLALLIKNADAEHRGLGRLERGQPLLKLARFLCAARRVVLWIEIEDDWAAFVIGEPVRLTILIVERERGRFLPWINQRHTSSNNTSTR